MTQRFQRKRWSPTRTAIHDLEAGNSVSFGPDQYFNVNSSVSRLNDAYAGKRHWTVKWNNRASTVTRVK